MFCLFIVSHGYAQIFIKRMPDCSKISFYEDNITIGKCNLHVYKAVTNEQKICGMLNFTNNTFKKDGMIFIGTNNITTHYFHTEGMQMDIRIMGVIRNKDGSYVVYDNDAKYSPPNIKSIIIYGHDVFETGEQQYQSYLNKCLLGVK